MDGTGFLLSSRGSSMILFPFHLNWAKESQSSFSQWMKRRGRIKFKSMGGINKEVSQGQLRQTLGGEMHFGIFGEVSARWLFFQNKSIAHVRRDSCLFSNVTRRKKPAGDKGSQFFSFWERLISDWCAWVDCMNLFHHDTFQTTFYSFRVQFRYAFSLQNTQTHEKQPEIWYRRLGKLFHGVGSPLSQSTNTTQSRRSLV